MRLGWIIPLLAAFLIAQTSPAEAQTLARREIYVVMLASLKSQADRPSTRLPRAFSKNSLYWRVVNPGQSASYQLCLGFFADRKDAERARLQLVKSFPAARVLAVPRAERDALRAAGKKPPVRTARPPAPTPVAPLPAPTAASSVGSGVPPVEGSADALMAEGRAAIGREDYAAAIRAFTRLITLPENQQSRDAREFLAVAYERRGDTARARAEYTRYLELYPEGEDSVRVRQRLASLSPAPRTQTLRAPPRTSGTSRTLVFGGLSQFYYRGNSTIDTQQVVANTLDRTTLSLTDQSALITSLDVSARFLDETHDNRLVFRDVNTQNFLEGQRDVNRLNAAYYDYKYKPADFGARIGRQPGVSGGVLGRFDGALLGFGLSPGLRLNVVGGVPVEPGFTIDSTRRFAGTGIEIGPIAQRWTGATYFIRQTVDGISDREAAGLELRYFATEGALVSLVDYDTLFRHVNIATLQGNWLAPSKTAFNFLADYRMTPSLQTSTATLGESTTSIRTLLETYSEEELRQRARALTARSAFASAGFTHPFSRQWQLGADFHVSRISHTDGTNNVPGTPGTGYVYTLTAQAIGTGLIATRDLDVLAVSRISAMDYDGSALRLTNRTPIDERWTLDASLLWYRQNNENGSTLQRVSPNLRLGYRWGERVTFELEGGAEYTTSRSAIVEEKTRRSYFSLGYRWDF